MKLKVRKAKPGDARRIALLRKRTFEKVNRKNYTKEQIDSINKLNPPSRILEKMKKRTMFCLVDENDKLLGVVGLEGNRIGGLFVKHNYIGKGFGKKLLDFIEDYAKKKGHKKVILYSSVYAEPFYQKQGFKKIYKRKSKASSKLPIPEIKMEKILR
jgi:predicted N-acetyltransferase YhbS